MFRWLLTRNFEEYRRLPKVSRRVAWAVTHRENRDWRVRMKALAYTLPLCATFLLAMMKLNSNLLRVALLLLFGVTQWMIVTAVEEAHTCRILRRELRKRESGTDPTD